MSTLSISRRRAIVAIGALGVGVAGSAALPAWSAEEQAADLSTLARDAYVWGLPLVITYHYRKLAADKHIALNRLFGSPTLSTPRTRSGGPNVDNLYGFAWLDLTVEPQILTVPDTHDRYYSVQLQDAYLNSFAYVGRRATGTKAGRYAIVGPNWRGRLPAGVKRVDSPTNHVLMLTRTMVFNEADLPVAVAVQRAYSLSALTEYPRTAHPMEDMENAVDLLPVPTIAALGPVFFDDLNAALVTDPPPARDAAFVASLSVLGVGPGKPPSGRSAALTETLAKAVRNGDALIRQNIGRGSRNVNGWMSSYDIEPFILDPLKRAAVNIFGPGAHIAQEALYFTQRNGPDGKPLSAEKSYVLHFPVGGLPPVDGFWSLTMYDQNWQLVDNPINRYAIGDRTHLSKQSDGSVRIFIQKAEPGEADVNWLPAPQTGNFTLVLRTYQPRPIIFEGGYKLPPLELVAPA